MTVLDEPLSLGHDRMAGRLGAFVSDDEFERLRGKKYLDIWMELGDTRPLLRESALAAFATSKGHIEGRTEFDRFPWTEARVRP